MNKKVVLIISAISLSLIGLKNSNNIEVELPSIVEATYTIDWYEDGTHYNEQSMHQANSVFINDTVWNGKYYYTNPISLDTTHFRPNIQIWSTQIND